MGLQFKILLPLMSAFAVFGGLFHYQWVPNQIQYSHALFKAQHEDVLRALEPDLRLYILANDWAALHHTLDQQMLARQGVWQSLVLYDAQQRRLYPLDEPQDLASPEHYLRLEHEVPLSTDEAARIVLKLDNGHHLEQLQQRVAELQKLVYFTLALMILLILLWQNLFIITPLLRLKQVAAQLAKGNFTTSLPKTRSRDEIATLNQAFSTMQLSLADTDRKKRLALEQSQANELRLEAIFQGMGEGLIITDEQGRIQSLNPAAESIFLMPQQELTGELFNPLFGAHLLREIQTLMQHHHWEEYRTSTNFSLEGEAIRKNGQRFPLELSISHIELHEETLFHLIVRDITERKISEEKLRQAMQKAEQASRTKSAFLANMSHEIRTPMNAIIGMTSLAMQQEQDPRQRNYLQKVERAAETLLQLINDILDFSKIEAGKMSLESIPFSVEDVLQDISSIIALPAQKKGLELIFATDPNLPAQLIGDPLRLGQILLNLTNNSVKFTDAGFIRIAIAVHESETQSAQVSFSVEDSGIGMTDEQQQNLFESFQQADASTTRQYGGTGLGLSICKRLVELMQGQIQAHSEAGKGSLFRFQIPLRAATKETLRARSWPDLSAQRWCLLSQDEHTAAHTQNLLEQIGAEVETINLSALESRNLNGFDGLIITLQKQDSQELFQRWLNHSFRPELAVVYLYPQSEESLPQTFNALGLRHAASCSKPLKLSSFYRAINQALGHKQEELTQPTAPGRNYESATAQLRGRKVLLVEDNPFNQELEMELLLSHGLQAKLAKNGKQALQLLQQERFDGVLMDCQMPVMDGYEATRKIRANPQWAALPVLAMTANILPEDLQKAQLAGMNDHIGKPIDLREMFIKMAIWFQPSAAQSSASEAPPSTLSADTRSLRYFEQMQYLDANAGLQRLQGDSDLYLRLLKKFELHKKEAGEILQQAWKDQDTPQINALLHSMKGVAGSIGALQLQQQSEALEAHLQVQSALTAEQLADWQQALQNTLNDIARLPEEETRELDIFSDEELAKNLSAQLKTQLSSFDVGATDTLQNWLKICVLPEQRQQLQQMHQALEDYDFETALNILQSAENDRVEEVDFLEF